MGQTMARLADWQTSILSTLIYKEGDDSAASPLMNQVKELLPDVERLLLHIWRRQLAASTGRCPPAAPRNGLLVIAAGYLLVRAIREQDLRWWLAWALVGAATSRAPEARPADARAFLTELTRVRTGRANVGLVDHIKVDYYGVQTPLVTLVAHVVYGTALGMFGAGNVGAAVTKFLAPMIMVAWGWQAVAQWELLLVLGRGGDPLYRGRHRQHPTELVRVLGGPRRDHAHGAQVDQQLVDAFLQPEHLAAERLVAEEDGRVGEVHHQFGGVLGLDEQLLDRASVPHDVPTCNRVMAATRHRTPDRSMVAVTIGMPWLSGSKPYRNEARASPPQTEAR
jgi:hypothetical protein